MLRTLMLDNVWVAVAICTSLYGLDYLLTIIGARMYYGGANRHAILEAGYELNPLFKKAINVDRRFSPIFVVMLAVVAGITWLAWFLYVGTGIAPWAFEFILGAFVCHQLLIQRRHLVAISSMRYTRMSEGIEGQCRISAWLTYSNHAADIFSFALVFGFLFAALGSWFLAGGMAACLLSAYGSSRHARRLRRKTIKRTTGGPSIA